VGVRISDQIAITGDEPDRVLSNTVLRAFPVIPANEHLKLTKALPKSRVCLLRTGHHPQALALGAEGKRFAWWRVLHSAQQSEHQSMFANQKVL
jgi:hypothetical protein